MLLPLKPYLSPSDLIPGKTLQRRRFKVLCEEVGTEHHALLLHTDIMLVALKRKCVMELLTDGAAVC